MGDVIHALPAVASLKHSFPHSHVTWVIRSRWAPLLEGNPFVDEVIPFERTLSGILATRRKLREHRFDLAVDFQGLVQSALVAAAARPDRLAGFAQVREKAAAFFYSLRVETQAPHVVDRNLELVAAAGASSLLHTFSVPEGSPEGSFARRKFRPHQSPRRLGVKTVAGRVLSRTCQPCSSGCERSARRGGNSFDHSRSARASVWDCRTD